MHMADVPNPVDDPLQRPDVRFGIPRRPDLRAAPSPPARGSRNSGVACVANILLSGMHIEPYNYDFGLLRSQRFRFDTRTVCSDRREADVVMSAGCELWVHTNQ
jgi:hypothetical protein